MELDGAAASHSCVSDPEGAEHVLKAGHAQTSVQERVVLKNLVLSDSFGSSSDLMGIHVFVRGLLLS